MIHNLHGRKSYFSESWYLFVTEGLNPISKRAGFAGLDSQKMSLLADEIPGKEAVE